eukprot:5156597-Prymnesium_polylepis.1
MAHAAPRARAACHAHSAAYTHAREGGGCEAHEACSRHTRPRGEWMYRGHRHAQLARLTAVHNALEDEHGRIRPDARRHAARHATLHRLRKVLGAVPVCLWPAARWAVGGAKCAHQAVVRSGGARIELERVAIPRGRLDVLPVGGESGRLLDSRVPH